jgi:hypothetical protein
MAYDWSERIQETGSQTELELSGSDLASQISRTTPRSSRALGAAAIEEAELAHPSADEVRDMATDRRTGSGERRLSQREKGEGSAPGAHRPRMADGTPNGTV